MADVYQIAMELNLDDKASEGLRTITDSLGRLGEELTKVTEGFKGLNAAVIAGAGVGIALGLTKMMEAANKFTDSLARMKITGLDTMRALEAANATARLVPSFTRERGLEEQRMLSAFMSPERAATMLPQAARTEEMFGLFGVQGGVESVMRMATMLGLTRPGRERELAAFMERQLITTQATQGLVTPSRMQTVLGRAGISAMQMDPEMMDVILPMMIESGIGGRMGPARAMAMLEQGGLRSLQGRGRGGMVDRRAMMAFLGRPITGQDIDQLGRNPYEWSQRVFKELSARGMQPQDDQNLLDALTRMVHNPQAAALLAAFMMQGTAALGAQSPFARFAAQRERALGTTEAGMAELEKLPSHNMEVLAARWTDLMTSIGSKDTELFNRWLISLRGFVTGIDDFIGRQSPETIQLITTALMGLAGALVALGTLGVLAAFLPGGWVTLAIFGIAAAVGLLGTLEWTKAESALKNLYDTINHWVQKMTGDSGQWDRIGNRPVFRRNQGPPEPEHEGHWDMIGNRRVWRPYVPPVPLTTPANPTETPLLNSPFSTGMQPQKDVSVALNLNLDGQTLGTAIWQSILAFQQFPSGAAAANTSAGWSWDNAIQNR